MKNFFNILNLKKRLMLGGVVAMTSLASCSSDDKKDASPNPNGENIVSGTPEAVNAQAESFSGDLRQLRDTFHIGGEQRSIKKLQSLRSSSSYSQSGQESSGINAFKFAGNCQEVYAGLTEVFSGSLAEFENFMAGIGAEENFKLSQNAPFELIKLDPTPQASIRYKIVSASGDNTSGKTTEQGQDPRQPEQANLWSNLSVDGLLEAGATEDKLLATTTINMVLAEPQGESVEFLPQRMEVKSNQKIVGDSTSKLLEMSFSSNIINQLADDQVQNMQVAGDFVFSAGDSKYLDLKMHTSGDVSGQKLDMLVNYRVSLLSEGHIRTEIGVKDQGDQMNIDEKMTLDLVSEDGQCSLVEIKGL